MVEASEGRKHRGHDVGEEQFCLDKQFSKSATGPNAGSWGTTSSEVDVHDFCSLAWHDFSI